MTQGLPQIAALGMFVFILFAHSLISRYLFSVKDTTIKTNRAPLIAFITGLITIVFCTVLTIAIYDVCCQKDDDLLNCVSLFAGYITQNLHGFYNVKTESIAGVITVLLLVSIAALYYCTHFSKDSLSKFTVYMVATFFGGSMFVFVEHAIGMFIAYEFLLIPTTLMIDHFAKTTRGKEASKFMLVWTQLGAVSLFSALTLLSGAATGFNVLTLASTSSRVQRNVIMLLAFFGFGAKMPVWPFYWWLPEAHVEVTTSFSIVLSGVSVKFAFLGFMRFINTFGAGDLYWLFALIVLFGAMDSACKMNSESDIKKIVAYQTVMEMHMLVIIVLVDFSAYHSFVLYMFATHCWLSALMFILVDILAKRYSTRNIEQLFGVFANSPKIVQYVYYCVFIGVSVPGTAVFSVEVLANAVNTTTIFNALFFVLLHTIAVVNGRNVWWFLFGGDNLYASQARAFTLTRSESLLVYILMLQLIPAFTLLDFAI